ncbi:MAG: Maf family protein [Acetatifactor sp.]
MRIILASASPRRRELLEQIGLEFEVKISNVQEKITAEEPGKIVEELSEQKARAVLDSLTDVKEDVIVIGADTIVAVGKSILGKPVDAEQAVEMLERLSGNTHQVYTGVTLYYRPAGEQLQQKTFHEMTGVTFYPMCEREISEYVSTNDCMDKAGAYGIQGFCARYIRGIEGDYSNVVGLPVGRLYQEIKEWLD